MTTTDFWVIGNIVFKFIRVARLLCDSKADRLSSGYERTKPDARFCLFWNIGPWKYSFSCSAEPIEWASVVVFPWEPNKAYDMGYGWI